MSSESSQGKSMLEFKPYHWKEYDYPIANEKSKQMIVAWGHQNNGVPTVVIFPNVPVIVTVLLPQLVGGKQIEWKEPIVTLIKNHLCMMLDKSTYYMYEDDR